MQSAFCPLNSASFHVAIIMDGNGRWAVQRGFPRGEGHRQGSHAVRRAVEAALRLGVTTLTLYAFSSDNWKRPMSEVNLLMSLFYDFLRKERKQCLENGIRLNVIGRRDRLSRSLRAAVESAEAATAQGEKMLLRIAIDYSARDSILFAASRLDGSGDATRENFAQRLAEVNHAHPAVPDVDLLIRTGGERRLSDFLLWECAYAELVFLETMWPDFTADDMEAAIREFHHRERRFGALPQAATA
ncbi:MAG: di-trans,poly-cis-decaprenylcistransferase [Candidatus Omnitrophota bacterium]